MDCRKLTYQIIDAIYKVYNSLTPSLNTEIYHQLLSGELTLRKVPFIEKGEFLLSNRVKEFEVYTPDFIIDEKIVIEISSFRADLNNTRLYSIIKEGNYKLGFLVNLSLKCLNIQHIFYSKNKDLTEYRAIKEA